MRVRIEAWRDKDKDNLFVSVSTAQQNWTGRSAIVDRQLRPIEAENEVPADMLIQMAVVAQIAIKRFARDNKLTSISTVVYTQPVNLSLDRPEGVVQEANAQVYFLSGCTGLGCQSVEHIPRDNVVELLFDLDKTDPDLALFVWKTFPGNQPKRAPTRLFPNHPKFFNIEPFIKIFEMVSAQELAVAVG